MRLFVQVLLQIGICANLGNIEWFVNQPWWWRFIIYMISALIINVPGHWAYPEDN